MSPASRRACDGRLDVPSSPAGSGAGRRRGRARARRAAPFGDPGAARLGERAPPHSSWSFVELAGRRRPPIGAAGGGEVGQGAGEPVGRLVEHDRARLARRPRASRAVRPEPLRGRNPSKTKRPVGSPLATSAVTAADGPGHDLDDVAGVDGGPHQPLAGIGDARHAGVGDHGDPLAPRQPVEHAGDRARPRCGRSPRRAARRATPACCEQPSGAPGVLAADGVGGRERLDGARRQVAEVADRGAHQHERHRSVLPLEAGRRRRGPTGRSAPASASSTRAGLRAPGGVTRWRRMRRRAQHGEVAVEPRHVDREAHPERVHRPGRPQQQRAVDRRPARAAPCGGRPGRRPPRATPAPPRRAAARPWREATRCGRRRRPGVTR